MNYREFLVATPRGLDDDGNEVVVHGVIGDPDAGRGDETKDPNRSLLSSDSMARLRNSLSSQLVIWCESPPISASKKLPACRPHG